MNLRYTEIQGVTVVKGISMAVALSALAVFLMTPVTAETITQEDFQPRSYATWGLEVNLTPWGYVEFTPILFVPVDAERRNYGDEGNQSQDLKEKLSEREVLLRVLHQKVPCRWDWDCKKLEREMPLIPLDKNICVGQVRFYDGRTDPLIPRYPVAASVLLGKTYTKQLRIGYKFTFKCGLEGYCVPDKLNYDVGIIGCRFGCLTTPVEKNGKVYSNFCVCPPGYTDDPLFCDPNNPRRIYYYRVDWTCEKSVDIAGYCPEGSVCSIVTPDYWECKPLSAQELFKQKGIDITTGRVQDGTERYTLLFPKHMSSEPIKVAFIRDGRVIAERPISDLTAWEYIQRHGPVEAGMAYAFALETGLVNEVTYAAGEGATAAPTSADILGEEARMPKTLYVFRGCTAILF